MGDWKKDKFGCSSNLESIVRDIVDEEIFPEPKNRLEKLKQGLEKTIMHYKNQIMVPLSALLGGSSAYLAYHAMQGLTYVVKIINPYADLEGFPWQMTAAVGMAVGAGSYIILTDAFRKKVGEKISGRMKETKKHDKKNKNFFQRHKLSLSLTLSAAYLGPLAVRFMQKINSLPPDAKQSLDQNTDKLISGACALSAATLGVLYLTFHVFGQASFFKNPEQRKQAYGQMLYLLSKKDGIKYWENESQKGNVHADYALAIYREEIDKKLEHMRKVIAGTEQWEEMFSKSSEWIKIHMLGNDYVRLKKNNRSTMLSLAITLYLSNPERAIRLMNKFSNLPNTEIKPEVLLTRNYLLNIHEDDKPENWNEFIEVAQKEGKLETKKGSEGKISYFSDRTFLKKNFISKYSLEDKTEKFLAEKAIHKILQGTEIRFENPLFIYNKGEEQIQIFLREGEKDLREALENKSVPEKRAAFEKAVRLLFNYQEKVFSAIQKKDGEFILNSEYRGNKQEIIIPILDLEKNLMIRAFIGLRKEGKKLGENEYLPALMDKLREQNQGYNKQPLTFNHGDALAQNITETLCIIDPRPMIAQSYYDITNLAADPVFLALDFQSRKETVLEATMKGSSAHFNEREQEENYDIFYLRNALCRTGSLFYHNQITETGMILNELIQFVRKKPFEREVMLYLKNSNVKGLMK
jgi:hypothetical protein